MRDFKDSWCPVGARPMAHPWQVLSLRTTKLSVSRITGKLLAALKLFLFTTAPPVTISSS